MQAPAVLWLSVVFSIMLRYLETEVIEAFYLLFAAMNLIKKLLAVAIKDLVAFFHFAAFKATDEVID